MSDDMYARLVKELVNQYPANFTDVYDAQRRAAHIHEDVSNGMLPRDAIVKQLEAQGIVVDEAWDDIVLVAIENAFNNS